MSDNHLPATPQPIAIDAEHRGIALPPNWSVADLGKLGMLPPPPRVQQKVILLTPEDFCAYVSRCGDEPSSMVFANEEAASFEAVVDYHNPYEEDPRGHCEHIALYACPASQPWQTWNKFSGKGLSQAEFATFLEENLPDIVEPAPAVLLEIALQLQVHKGAKFDSELVLESGQRQLKYIEEIRGTSRSGALEVPKTFQIAIPVFVDGQVFPVTARLKYRMLEGVLTLWYELVRAQDIFRNAVKIVTKAVEKGLGADREGGIRVLKGKRA